MTATHFRQASRVLAAPLLAFGLAGAAGAQQPPTAVVDGSNDAILPYVALPVAGETANAIQSRMRTIYQRPVETAAGSEVGTTLWGQGYSHAVRVDEGAFPYDGDVTGGMVGIDFPGVKPGLVFGLGLSRASSEMPFHQIEANGDPTPMTNGAHDVELNGLHPYFGWQIDEDSNVWGTVGIARGELEVSQSHLPAMRYEEDLEWKTLNVGGYNRFREHQTVAGATVNLGFVGDGLYSIIQGEGPGALKVDAGRLRFGLEVGYERALSTGARFGSTLEMTARQDFGDIHVGTGVEIGGGLDFTMPDLGLRLSLETRALLAHQSDDVRQWGVSGGIVWAF